MYTLDVYDMKGNRLVSEKFQYKKDCVEAMMTLYQKGMNICKNGTSYVVTKK